MARGHSYPEDLRDRLVAAAAERLVAAPPDQLSLRELAASQGTTTNAIYSIFGGKQALIDAVLRQATETFLGTQQAALDKGPTLAGLVQLGAAYRAWALENPALYRLMFGRTIDTSPPMIAERAAEPLVPMVSQLVDQGLLRDLPVETICHALRAATHGFVLMEMAERPHPDEASARFADYQQIFLRGLLTEEARAQLGSVE